MPPGEVTDVLGVEAKRGLGESEAAARLEESGPNRVERLPTDPLWKLLLEQFRNPLVLLLMAAAAVAALVGEARDALVIATVVLLNAALGFTQEWRAQNSMQALRRLLTFTARCRRAGTVREIDGDELVPGDIVLIEAGDRVPADARILGMEQLEVDESMLTGESVAVHKQVEAVEEHAAPAERSSEVLAGTTVTRGCADTVVTATGMSTAMGAMAQEIRQRSGNRSPLEDQLARLATRLTVLALVAATAVVAVSLARGDPFGSALTDGVVLAVASIPEGLPAIVTVTLALGVRAMAREAAVVDDLRAIHSLGAVTTLCTDKTGTLTVNEMTVRHLFAGDTSFEVTGEGHGTEGDISPEGTGPPDPCRTALEVGVLCNDAQLGEEGPAGDATEVALLVLAEKAGMSIDQCREDFPRVGEVPFSSERAYMATFNTDRGGVRLCAKGAPEVLLPCCSSIRGADGARDVEDADREGLRRHVREMTGAGQRVLVLASADPAREVEVPSGDGADEGIGDLCFEALVGMSDPPRAESRDAVEEFRAAGIKVVMVTGDHDRTAAAVAEEVGIEGDVLVGTELADMTDEELAGRMMDVAVLARVDPLQKVRVVDALKANGQVVAMTGDGVNDAAALHKADVGVAMGQRGAEVAKEAGDLVLTDDRISTIVKAVRRGRTIYDNIMTFVRFNLATNAGALMAILTARMLGLPAPFTPIQVLWVNLIMDGPPAMALGADPPADDIMRRPPRQPGERILDRERLVTVLVSGLWMALGVLLVFWYGGAGRDEPRATTLAFTTFVLFQVVNALNVRVRWQTLFSRRTLSNPVLWMMLVLVVVLQVVVVQVPALHGLFGTQGMSAGDWALAIGVAASLALMSEAARAVRSWLS